MKTIQYYVPNMDAEPTSEKPEQSFEFKAILVVDDDRQLVENLQWILADQNYLVDVAYDGEDALNKVRENHFDVVVCDVQMPKLCADEFYKKAVIIRSALKDRFIFITSCRTNPQINLSLCRTGAKYLFKPFEVRDLIDCVQQRLR